MIRRRFSGHKSSGANPPTRDAVIVQRAGVRAPVRAVLRREPDPAWGGDTIILTCGHEKSGKPRKDGRYSCYTCQVEIAKLQLGEIMKSTLRANLWRLLTAAGVLDELRATPTQRQVVCRKCSWSQMSGEFIGPPRFDTIYRRCEGIAHALSMHSEVASDTAVALPNDVEQIRTWLATRREPVKLATTTGA